ncbi:hypothetical protein Pelo_10409 [Pelomyxa schiedti]|nr:hypothetical protein Pelo_10409 [Pelomyxa schiedti]
MLVDAPQCDLPSPLNFGDDNIQFLLQQNLHWCPVSSPERPPWDTERVTQLPLQLQSFMNKLQIKHRCVQQLQWTTHVEVVNEDCLVAASRLKHEVAD